MSGKCKSRQNPYLSIKAHHDDDDDDNNNNNNNNL